VSDSTVPVIITHSDIQNYLSCRRKWYYDYVLDYRAPEKLTGHLALGTRVHAALEAFYKGETTDPVDWIDKKGREDLAALEVNPDAKPWDFDQMYKDMIIGRNCIVAYLDWLETTNADANYRTVSVEERVEVPILGGRAILRGKVDILKEDMTNGFLCTDDFKTYARDNNLREQLERSYQHWCYLIGMQHNYPERIVECSQYTLLRKVERLPSVKSDKSPMVQRFTVPATRRNLEAKKAQIERIATEMLHLRDQTDPAVFYPEPGDPCKWCEYKAPCEIADESVEASLALLSSGKYVHGKRYARYETGGEGTDA
jgi:CRISPR/Cas system-associated exonuclease Cas4 (RecB family)